MNEVEQAASQYAWTKGGIPKDAFLAGADYAFDAIRREIDNSAMLKHTFPVMHLLEFMDTLQRRGE